MYQSGCTGKALLGEVVGGGDANGHVRSLTFSGKAALVAWIRSASGYWPATRTMGEERAGLAVIARLAHPKAGLVI